MQGHGEVNLLTQRETCSNEINTSPAAIQSASFSFSCQYPTHSVWIGDVGVVDWWQGRQLHLIRRMVWETHYVTVALDVAMANGEWRVAVLWSVLKVALLFHLSPHGGVPVVLYGVVSPVWINTTYQITGNTLNTSTHPQIWKSVKTLVNFSWYFILHYQCMLTQKEKVSGMG